MAERKRAPKPAVCKVVSNSPDLASEYLFRFLPQELKRIEAATPFVTVKHLSVKTIREIQIPLPPLEEQRRIAEDLDRADALRQKRRFALQKLDILLQSVFLDMFGDPVTNPKGWETLPVLEVADLENGDRSSNYPSGPDVVDEGVLFLSTKNIDNDRLVLDSCQFITEKKFRSLSRGKLRRFDIPITLRGTLGSCAVFDCHFETGFINAQLLIVRPRGIEPQYLHKVLSSRSMREHFSRIATGVAVKQLTARQVGALEIPIPPIDLQKHYTELLAKIEHQMVRNEKHLFGLDKLFASIQSRAFSGQLFKGSVGVNA